MLPSIQGSPGQGRPPQTMPQGVSPQGQPPSRGVGQGVDKAQIIEGIKQVLQRIKSMAQEYDIDLASIMAEMDQGSMPAGKSPMPPPPSMPSSPPPSASPM